MPVYFYRLELWYNWKEGPEAESEVIWCKLFLGQKDSKVGQVAILFQPVCVICNRPVKIIYSMYLINYLYNTWDFAALPLPESGCRSAQNGRIALVMWVFNSFNHYCCLYKRCALKCYLSVSSENNSSCQVVGFSEPSNPLEDSLVLMFLKREDEVNVKLQRLNAARYVYSHSPPGMSRDD